MLSPDELATALTAAAHGEEGLQTVQEALGELEFAQRLEFLATHLVVPPLAHELAERRAGPIDAFNVLQGDVIVTSSAYELGTRRESQTYLVATSTCDLLPGRRATALLFPVVPQRRESFESEGKIRGTLKQLTRYRDKRYFYLPVFPDDEADVLCNVAYLDPLCTCDNEAVNLASRRASMSLLGWRLFGVMCRQLLIREAASEAAMRTPTAEEL